MLLLLLSHGKPPSKYCKCYNLFSDEKLIAGAGVAAAVIVGAGIAAAGRVLLPVLVWASQQQKDVVVHQSGQNPSDRDVAG